MRNSSNSLVGAIEAGGTKWVCAVGKGAEVLEEVVVPTEHPGRTLPEVLAVFDGLEKRHGKIAGMGVGTFGPVVVERGAERYGTILNSPKLRWRGFNFVSALKGHFGNDFPVVVDTDVNAAAFAEYREPETLIYITVGTGIGGGIVGQGGIWHGRGHPEIGHLMVPESPQELKRGFSCCPFHLGCVEGKASGTAMKDRWGVTPEELPEGHDGWELEAGYLSSLAIALTAAFSPDRIVWGGGVMKFKPLLAMMREEFEAQAGGYWDLPDLGSYLTLTTLNDRAGLRGALALISRELGS